MKRTFFPLVAILMFCLGSCSTDFNVAAPYKAVTVAYGLLDMADTAHYIRIEKAFLDNNKSAIVMAQNPDSLYFSNLNVVVKAINSNKDVDNVFVLSKVDLNAEGYPKQTGTFAASHNYGYKFKTLLQSDHTYRLVITNPATSEVDSSETPVINDKDGTTLYVEILDPTIHNSGLQFFSTSPDISFTDIYGQYSNYTGAENPAIYQGTLRFRWIDSNTSSTHVDLDSADYNLGTVYPSVNGGYQFSTPNLSLYNFISKSLGAAPASHVRVFDSCVVIIYAGTQPLLTYQQYAQIAGTGLTGSTIEPIYSNLSGRNVYGLYADRALRTGKAFISSKTLDSLSQSSITHSALIQNHMR